MFQHGLFLGVKKSLGHAHIGLLGLIQNFRRTSPPLSYADPPAPPPPGVQPGSQNPDPILDQKCHFSHWFSDLVVVTKRNITCLNKPEIMSTLLKLKQQQKDFLKSISNYTFFLIHLELKRRTHWCTNVVPP